MVSSSHGPVNSGTDPLPSSLSYSVATSLTDTVVTSAAAPTSFTTISVARQSLVIEDGTTSTIRYTTTSVITNSAVYSHLSAAAAASHSSKTQSSSSVNASSTKSSTSTSAKSSSNLSTIIPAVVVPVVFILVATFAAFWFYMRRRHRRDLQNQPAFVMATKTEKLTSTTNSLASEHRDHGPPTETNLAAALFSHSTEKPLPSTRTRDVPSRPSDVSSRAPPNYSRNDVGVARTSNVREEQRPSPLLPPVRTDSSSPNPRHIATFASNASPTSNYSPKTSRSANPHLGPQTPHNSVLPGTRNNISGRGPPAGVGTSIHVLSRNRSQSLSNPRGAGNPSNSSLNSAYRNGSGPALTQRPPTAPNSGFRGPHPPQSFSPAGQQQASRSFSPIGNRAPPPAPIKAPTSPGAFINQPQYSPIIRDAPKAQRPSVIVPSTQNRGISIASHTSPLLPSPKSDNRHDHNLTAENLRIARLANTSRLGFLSPSPDHDNDNISEISAPEDDEPEADAKSDVSSLNELEKFDFERDTRSASGSALGNLPGTRSGSAMNNNSPILGPGHESPWR